MFIFKYFSLNTYYDVDIMYFRENNPWYVLDSLILKFAFFFFFLAKNDKSSELMKSIQFILITIYLHIPMMLPKDSQFLMTNQYRKKKKCKSSFFL
jgi:hypothetical protein